MLMRVVLFVATNIAVLVVLNVAMHLLGLDRALAGSGGLNLTSLLVMAGIMGCAGSFISLALSKWMAKRATGARVIEQPRDATEAWLLATVERQARAAGIGMPEVAIYDAPDMNAFATGMDKNHALVAVSSGLLRHMRRDEVEAVLGHEVSHVANGDMVTLALIQGVVNTFVIFFSRIIGHLVDAALRGNRGDGHAGYGPGYMIASLVAQVVLGVLASMIVAWFSRRREFRADAGGAQLSTREAMIGALDRLRAGAGPSALPQSMQAFGISGGGGFTRLFMSHPPLEERIRALAAA